MSCGFRLPNLRCLQCPVLGISKGLCAFRNVDYAEIFASEGSSLGISSEEGWVDTFSNYRREQLCATLVGRGGARSAFQHHSSSPDGNQHQCMAGMAILWASL